MLAINRSSRIHACTLSSCWLLILEPLMKLTFLKAGEWYTKFYGFTEVSFLPMTKVSDVWYQELFMQKELCHDVKGSVRVRLQKWASPITEEGIALCDSFVQGNWASQHCGPVLRHVISGKWAVWSRGWNWFRKYMQCSMLHFYIFLKV